MKKTYISQLLIRIFSLCWCLPALAIYQGKPLTLSEAEMFALSSSPELRRFQETRSALEEQSIADRQLTDLQLVAGVINIPTNNFSFT